MNKLTTEQFIIKAKSVHGDQYDYTSTTYTRNSDKLTIQCKHHGSYSQLPSNHLRGRGCPKCGRTNGNLKKTLTGVDFIKKSNEIHLRKYDYTKVVYTTNVGKVDIICPMHGKFIQKAYVHLSGSGCPACAGNVRMTTQTFIQRAHGVHGTKYVYDNVTYYNEKTHISVICSKHGVFSQRPSVHLSGSGCPTCGLIVSATSSLRSCEDFISKAISVHGDSYDYTNTVYTGTSNYVDIVCSTHGTFVQLASNHLLGHGCRRCANDSHVGGYNYDRLTTDPDLIGKQGRCYITKFVNEDEMFYKVGITTQRNRFHNSVEKYTVTEQCSVVTSLLNAFVLEQNILHVHKDDKHYPSVKFGGHTECLNLSSSQLDDIVWLFNNISKHECIIPIISS